MMRLRFGSRTSHSSLGQPRNFTHALHSLQRTSLAHCSKEEHVSCPRPPSDHIADVVVIGAGIGGLSCAAMLANYGLDVTVLESHAVPGGAARGWKRRGYHFESGPSLYSGLSSTGKDANPLAHVLHAIGEPLDIIEYDHWNVLLPEGHFKIRVGASSFEDVLLKVRGPHAISEWRRLQDHLRPLAAAASAVPAAAMRHDAAGRTTTLLRYPAGALASKGLAQQAQMMGALVEGVVTDPFIKNWLDLFCFLLSGSPAASTHSSEVAFMFNEWLKPRPQLEFPRGGSHALVEAFTRSITKRGGRVHGCSHVNSIMLEGGRAVGVVLKAGIEVRARKAVVTNASLWDVQKLLPGGTFPGTAAGDTGGINGAPVEQSFLHLHVGFDATGLEDLDMHYVVVDSWEGGVTKEQNVACISIPSVVDPALAPPGKHALHAYFPATEPYQHWEGMDPKSDEYKALKEERSQGLWAAIERVVPDIRARAEVSLVGTPLTHARFLRRHGGHRGAQGHALLPFGQLPGGETPVPGLLACGDSTFPGIGLPAVAASGAIAANTLVPVWQHVQLLDELGI